LAGHSIDWEAEPRAAAVVSSGEAGSATGRPAILDRSLEPILKNTGVVRTIGWEWMMACTRDMDMYVAATRYTEEGACIIYIYTSIYIEIYTSVLLESIAAPIPSLAAPWTRQKKEF
jgi:hypothetical protein